MAIAIVPPPIVIPSKARDLGLRLGPPGVEATRLDRIWGSVRPFCLVLAHGCIAPAPSNASS
jgi:hypothetical protein